ncbi:MAG TPA: aldo/keto reductase, partial [Elusimicrobia bacterium]|nr:aldo/keto reductase [Elusimicrobiota bacterium]
VFTILNKAVELGIDTLDTAYSYGDSESVIGDFIGTYDKKLKIISKLPECKENEVNEIFNFSLNRLNVTKLYGYLVHNFENYKKNPQIWDVLEKLKIEKKVEKIGFSFYYPSELEFLFNNNIKLDIIQIPYNIFDRRFEPYFEEIKSREIELYIRSLFLQGLVFKSTDDLPSIFNYIKNKIKELQSLSRRSKVSVVSLCVNFVINNNLIDKVVIGIDSVEHFDEIIKSVSCSSLDENTVISLKNFKIKQEKIIIPVNWNKYIKVKTS